MRVPGRVAVATGVTLAALCATPPVHAGPRACGDHGLLAAATMSNIDVVDAAGADQWRVAAGTSGPLSSYSPTSPLAFGMTTDPSWSPDGRSIAYGITDLALFVSVLSELRVVSAAGTDDTPLVSIVVAGTVSEVAWSPDGRTLAFVLWTRNYPLAAATWTAVGDATSIWLVRRDGNDLRPVAVPTGHVAVDLAWAPNGRQLAFTAWRGTARIHVADVSAAVPVAVPVTPPGSNAEHPVWSPDSRQLAFTAEPLPGVDSRMHLWIAEATGANARRLPVVTDQRPSWSPDGRWLAVGGWRPGIVAVSVDGTRVRGLTADETDGGAAWSPDGARLAFVRGVPMRQALWTVDLRTGTSRAVSRPGMYAAPRWCPIP